jgi:integrase
MAQLLIKHRKTGLFAYYGVSHNGKKIWISRGRVFNRKIAEKEFKTWERNLDKEKLFKSPISSPTLSEFIPIYLAHANGKTLSGGGLACAELALRNASQILGSHKIAEINPQAVDLYVIHRKGVISERTKKPLAPRTINNDVTQLSALMRVALDMDLIPNHPFVSDKRPLSSFHLKVDLKNPTFLMSEEIKAFYEQVEKSPHSLTVFMFLLLTGVRISELKGLKWEDVDLENRKLTVRAPKTNDFRTLPIPEELYPLLLRMKTFWPDRCQWIPRLTIQNQYVFCNKQGGPFVWNVGLFLKRQGAKLGLLKRVTPQVLRHTFATYGKSQLTVFQLQKLLGHKNVSTTEKYGFLLDQGMQEGTNKIAASMGLPRQVEEQKRSPEGAQANIA